MQTPYGVQPRQESHTKRPVVSPKAGMSPHVAKTLVIEASQKRAQMRSEPSSKLSSALSGVSLENFSDENVKKAFDTPATQQRGACITATFKDNKGREFAKEQAVRAPTIEIYTSGLHAKLDHLQTREHALEQELQSLGNQPRAEKKRAHLRSSLATVQASLAQTKEAITQSKRLEGSTWASTNAPRFLFKQSYMAACQKESDPKVALVVGKEDAKRNYIPILGNLRNQTVEIEGKTVSSTNRSAALSDFSNNETNLQEMKDYSELRKLQQDPQGGDFKEGELDRLAAYYQLGEPVENKNLAGAIAAIEKNIKQAYGEDMFDPSAKGLNMDKLHAKVSERQDRLDNLFLQDLVTQHTNSEASGKVFHYARQSLVDTTRRSSSGDGGLVLNERNQAMDTRAAVLAHNGRELVYDLDDPNKKAAFIDPETGAIHLSKQLKPPGMQEGKTTLQTRFSNISVAGNKQNLGMQAHMNRECLQMVLHDLGDLAKEIAVTTDEATKRALEAKLKRGKQLHREIQIDFKAGRGGFNVVEKMTLLLQNQNHLSVNCYGGKDRTGYTLALISHNHMSEHVKAAVGGKKTTHVAVMDRIGRELVSQDSVALRVIEDNIGHKVIKLDPKLEHGDLKLYFGEDRGKSAVSLLKGVPKRLFDFGMFFSQYTPGGKMGEGVLYSNEQREQPVVTVNARPTIVARG